MLFENIVELNVRGENMERFLNMCSYHKIKIFNIRKTDSECYMEIYATDFFLIKDMVRKSGVHLKIIRKEGFYFYFKKQAKRKVFII